jgi:hypothetical protein
MYTAWAMGDGWSGRNRALWNIVKDKVTVVGSSLFGVLVGGWVGNRIGNNFGNWGGGIIGGGIGTAAGMAISGASTGEMVREIGLGLLQSPFSGVRSAASSPFVGVAIGAGFYAGVVEYLADSAFDWWKT